MRSSTLHAVLAAFALLATPACGPGAPREQETVKIESTAALDGYVRSDGTFDAAGGFCVTGDLDGETNGLGSRQFFSFDLSSIEPPVQIEYATLCIHQLNQVGTPYFTHGAVIFEHVVYGEALDGADYDCPILRHLGGLNAQALQQSGRCVTATEAVAADFKAGRTHAQFRIRFENFDSDADGVSDFADWADTEQTDLHYQRASLEIVYRPIRTR